MTTTTPLAERIEQAEGPSDRLDAEIEVLMQRPRWPDATVVKMGKRSAAVALRGNTGRGWRRYGLFFQTKRYTRSVDTALTLVDPRALWAVINMEDGPIARLVWPQDDGGYIGGYIEARAATPALALCAAALRSRSQDNGGKE